MITVAIDTCEARGSVAVRRDKILLAGEVHADGTDYSAWLLPAVGRALLHAGVRMEQISLFAVATGPGSFTGLRVGLTTVKAWSEVYGKQVVGVSRLEAMACSGSRNAGGFVAACYNAQRGQLFAALYERLPEQLQRVDDELVISPEEFVEYADQKAGEGPVTWVSLDPEMIDGLEKLKRRLSLRDSLELCSPELASLIGALGEERGARGEFSDSLTLDANYVRRSDAEIFWKGPASNVP